MRQGGRYVVDKDGKTERVEGTEPAAARKPDAPRPGEAARRPARSKAALPAPAAPTGKEE